MANQTDAMIGTQDLEKGLHASPAATFRTVAGVALILLLLFNSAGLVRWTQQLPSNAVNVWLSERASDWHQMMLRLGPAVAFERAKSVLKVE
jgi:hypothetical protein